MTLPAALRAIADRIEAADAARRSAIATLAELAGGAYNIVDELGRALDADAAEVMRDGSSIEPDSASVQVADGGGPGGQSSPSAPPASAPIDAGAVRVERTPADQAGERGIDTRPPLHSAFDPLGAPPALTCPECGGQFKAQGLAPHRAKKHGVAGHGRLRPASTSGAAAPVIRKGAETWVCSRCPEAFHTREARDLHQATHPPVPLAMPVRTVGGGLRRVKTLRRAA